MPRLPRIRLRVLDDLARQLRFSPSAAAARQVAAVIELASEIDPDRAYAEDWVARRITRFRTEVSDPVQLVGAALLADLSAFAERVSARARLEASDLGRPLLGREDLQRRWSVSARTLERYRRRGLIGVRVRSPQSGVTLMFSVKSIEGFERAEAGLLRAARAYRRTTREARDRIVEDALVHRTMTGDSLGKTARALAPSVGASEGAVRRVLRGRVSAAFGVSDRSGARERLMALRSWSRGIGPGRIAERLGVARATVHRLINSERATRLRLLDLAGPVSPKFGGVRGEAFFLSDEAVRMGLGEPGDTDALALAAASRARVAPKAEHERVLASAYHFLRWRASRAIAGLGNPPGGRALDQIETDLRWAALLKIELIRGERPLIVRSIEERAGVALLDLSPAEIRRWEATAFQAAGDGVDRFDPFKQGRLATPISLALARALAGLKPSPPSRRAHPASLALDDWSRVVAAWQAWLEPPVRVRARARDEAGRALRLRFGWGLGPPMTLEMMRREHAVSPARLWKLMSR
ncbi:MAG: hypothetical protein JNK58_09545 [Phycisphaerae bacterium]|nr:hypothetical protein [Phycisphaerae bacterium]